MSLGAANTLAFNTLALAALAIGWLAVAGSLLGGLVRRKRHDLLFRFIGVGMLVMLTGGLLSQCAVVRQWPHSQQLVIDGITLLLGVAGIACVIAGIALRARSRGV